VKLPRIWYGAFSEVKSRSNRAITALARGAAPDVALGANDLVDTDDHPGLLVLQGPSPLVGAGPHWHCYATWRLVGDAVLKGRLARDVEAALLRYALTQPWGLLSVLRQDTQMWLWPESTHEPFLTHTLASWRELDALGARYSLGLDRGATLWSLPTNLHHVLARRGVSVDTLIAPLPKDGLAALVARALAARPAAS
jgi:hypothetical protein